MRFSFSGWLNKGLLPLDATETGEIRAYNKKTSFMVAVFPGLSLNDRAGYDVRSALATRRLHSTSKIFVVALLVTWSTIVGGVMSTFANSENSLG